MALSSPAEATKSADAGRIVQSQQGNSTEEPETNSTAMYGFKLYVIFIGICVGTFLMSLDIFVIATVSLRPFAIPKKETKYI
jgi:hypothetical protein